MNIYFGLGASCERLFDHKLKDENLLLFGSLQINLVSTALRRVAQHREVNLSNLIHLLSQ